MQAIGKSTVLSVAGFPSYSRLETSGTEIGNRCRSSKLAGGISMTRKPTRKVKEKTVSLGGFASPSVLRMRLVFAAVGFATLCLVSECNAKAGTAEDCASLANLVVENTTITSARLIPAGGELPEYCEVQGHVDTEIGFELRLPTAWNAKFYF